jgi:hypothetical protein
MFVLIAFVLNVFVLVGVYPHTATHAELRVFVSMVYA